MTTEERLYKLEGIVEGVMATLPDRVSSLEHRMDLLRQEVKAEITGLRQEMKSQTEGLRQEMREEIARLDAKIDTLRQEVKAEINTALNRLMLYFTALTAALALLTLFARQRLHLYPLIDRLQGNPQVQAGYLHFSLLHHPVKPIRPLPDIRLHPPGAAFHHQIAL